MLLDPQSHISIIYGTTPSSTPSSGVAPERMITFLALRTATKRRLPARQVLEPSPPNVRLPTMRGETIRRGQIAPVSSVQ